MVSTSLGSGGKWGRHSCLPGAVGQTFLFAWSNQRQAFVFAGAWGMANKNVCLQWKARFGRRPARCSGENLLFGIATALRSSRGRSPGATDEKQAGAGSAKAEQRRPAPN